jgi:putative exporter of polyketide antibiotics
MKWLLIVTALNMEAVYPDADMCGAAASAIENKMQHTAVCIPKPEDRMDIVISKFVAIVRELQDDDDEK